MDGIASPRQIRPKNVQKGKYFRSECHTVVTAREKMFACIEEGVTFLIMRIVVCK